MERRVYGFKCVKVGAKFRLARVTCGGKIKTEWRADRRGGDREVVIRGRN